MMRPEELQEGLNRILEQTVVQITGEPSDGPLYLSDTQIFTLWNLLGEELGIDLSLATESDRRLLMEACASGKSLSAKDFGSLLWLVYYSDVWHH